MPGKAQAAADEDHPPMTTSQIPDRPWHQKAIRSFRKRWVQVCAILLGCVFALVITNRVLAPKEIPGKAKDKSRYKFLHCNICKLEIGYSEMLDGKQCMKCIAPKPVGYFVATENSIKSGSGDGSPWVWFYLAASIEVFGSVGWIVYLLYLPVPDPTTTFYIYSCPNCNHRMRFRRTSLGHLGACSKCKRPFRFPDEDEAVLEADLQRQEAEMMVHEYIEDDHDGAR